MFGRGRRAWIPFAILLAIAALFLFPFLIKALWNWLMPPVFHLGMITYWQALGILVLAKILFGGFHGRRGGGGGSRTRERVAERMGERMAERWEKMTPEERESFSRGMQGRCGPSSEQQPPPTPASPAPGA